MARVAMAINSRRIRAIVPLLWGLRPQTPDSLSLITLGTSSPDPCTLARAIRLLGKAVAKSRLASRGRFARARAENLVRTE